ncbi:DUF998 domain-containing protein [Streptomyces sp. UNOC14_S4]|uniref:DUF998 domain-containing protein n=1 Tax=Streptomyces sp. UNOC14_S4 TaxID=2872340 RepID=UPI001E2AED64|nr:DUF998 domain-containing protein [Streptomyces sp. UNOC14_S4]MCC3767602.1 DUF998 domain-containing protein [Streptomyces sp. UNOC14_S4]
MKAAAAARPRAPDPGPVPSGRRYGRLAVALLLALSAALYAAWLAEALLDTGEDPVRTYVSELAAGRQPYRAFFQATDLASGLCALLAGVLALLCVERRRWSVTGFAALAVFGADTALESRCPLTCALAGDPACTALDAAGRLPAVDTVHAVTSAVAVVSAMTALLALTAAARDGSPWPLLARVGPRLNIALFAVGVWVGTAVIAFSTRQVNLWLGLAERTQLSLISAGVLVVAVSIACTAS